MSGGAAPVMMGTAGSPTMKPSPSTHRLNAHRALLAWAAAAVLLLAAVAVPAQIGVWAGDTPPKAPSHNSTTQRDVALGWEPNQGQADPVVRFLSRGGKAQAFLTSTSAVLATGDSRVDLSV